MTPFPPPVSALNVPHGVKALEDGAIIDAFTPIRKDFLGA